VEKIKRRAEARAEAPKVSKEHGPDIEPATGTWSDWNTNCVADESRISTEDPRSTRLINLSAWRHHRQERAHEYTGLGYSTTISSFAASRSREQRHAHSIEKEYQRPTHSQQRDAARTRQAFRMKEDTEDCYTVFKAFNSLPALQAQKKLLGTGNTSRKSSRRSYLDELIAALPKSKVVSPTRSSIVDSGSTINIVADEDDLDDIDTASIIKIMAFNSSVTRSKGCGKTFGYVRSADGRKVIPLKIPQAHHVPGAPHDLLSVSAMVLLGYEFHFIKSGSYIVTPDGDRVELLQEKGLIGSSGVGHMIHTPQDARRPRKSLIL